MTRARGLLAVDIAAFGLFGLAFVFWPVSMTRFVTGVAPGSPGAITDIRAIYGGMALGLTAFFALAYRGDANVQRIGVAASALAFGCIAIARTIGLVADGSGNAIMFAQLAAEALAAILSTALLARIR
jgi:hypothetical protein